MRAGQLRHRVDIESVSKTRTASGGYEDSYVLKGKSWASIMPLTGREFFENLHVGADITHEIKLRSHIDLSPSDRIMFNDSRLRRIRHFNIVQSMDVAERGISLRVMAKEVVA